MIEIEEIRDILPHRYPFLLVDRILKIEGTKKIVGLKNVTINEEFFQGHFPGHAVMPGVLVIEAMAQVGGVLLLSLSGNAGKLAYLGGVDSMRFRKPVLPGDTLVTEVELLKSRGTIGRVRATASVDNEVVAEGEFIFALVERKTSKQKADAEVGNRVE